MADNSAPRNPHVRAGSKSDKGGLDTPLSGRQRILPKFRPNPDAFGQTTEGFARFMGTPQFLVYMSVFVVVWLAWNTFLPDEWQFDSRALGFTLLTLMLSLQASYAAPLLLLAQNRQDDRDRVSLQQDRQRAERNLSDTEYLTRELASLRIALREVATRDYVRAELRSLLEEMLEAQEELRTHDPSVGAHGSPRDKVKEKLKERRDKRSPRTQQIPRVKTSSKSNPKPGRKADTAPDSSADTAPDTFPGTGADSAGADTLPGTSADSAGATVPTASPEN
ncbi:putative membrane protein [Arthrobacter ginsengisoli]|uniref:Membrane protein n=1 Tax=Arthrobacter ginsengisoli TaxID=1356565 RepID=A0ABU1UAZ7_9MICC|nr:putative membrane protein [Arthrobacter ginsengisoli]